MVRRIGAFAALVAVCAAAPVSSFGAQRLPAEYAVKAAFLYQFGNFVVWPEGERPAFRICVMGIDPFGAELEGVLRRAAPIDGRPAVARRVLGPRDAGECEILFVSPSEQRRFGEILEVVPAGILTVGEGAAFLAEGGMLAFEIEDDRVRFDVDLAATREAGLQISSQLLGVARRVLNAPEEP